MPPSQHSTKTAFKPVVNRRPLRRCDSFKALAYAQFTAMVREALTEGRSAMKRLGVARQLIRQHELSQKEVKAELRKLGLVAGNRAWMNGTVKLACEADGVRLRMEA